MPSEATLIQQYQQSRDPQVLDSLMARHYPAVYRVLLNLVHQEADAADLAQQTFLRILQQGEGFRGEGSFRAWALQVAVNEARQFWRRGKRVQPEDPLFTAWLENQDLDAAEKASRREFEHALGRALTRLPARLKEPVVLHYFEQLSLQEIAGLLQLPKSTVQSRINKAVGQLRKDFERRRLGALLPVLQTIFAEFPAVRGGGVLGPGLLAGAAALLLAGAWWLWDGGVLGSEPRPTAQQVAANTPVAMQTTAGADGTQSAAPGERASIPGGTDPGEPVRREVHSTGPGLIRGRLWSTSLNAPLRGARISLNLGHSHKNQWLSAEDPRWFRNRYPSDAEGHFICDALPLGRVYEIYIRHPDHGYRLLRNLEFAPGQTEIDVGTLLCSEGTQLQGRVLDPEGHPVAGANLSLGGLRRDPGMLSFAAPHTPLRGATARSGADGRFVLHGLSAGWHRLEARHEDFATLHLGEVQVPAAEPLELRMQRPAVLEARVVDEQGQPVADCDVRLQILESARLGEQGFASWRDGGLRTSDSEGRVRFAHLSAGGRTRYSLEAVRGEQRSSQVDAIAGTGEVVELRLPPAPDAARGSLQIRARLAAGSGTLFDPAGRLGRGEIHIRSQDWEGRWLQPEADGSFVIAGLAAGKYRLSVAVPGFITHQQRLELTQDLNLPLITLQRGGSMSGRITDAGTGQPLAHAAVHLDGQIAAYSDDDGRYRCSGIKASPHSRLGIMWVTRRGYANAQISVPPSEADSTLHKDVRMKALATRLVIRGRVRGPDDEALAGVQIRIHYQTDQGQYSQIQHSGTDGSFSLPGPTPDDLDGDCYLSLWHPAYARRIVPLLGRAQAVLELRMQPGRQVRGVVRDQHGQPVARARVGAFLRRPDAEIPDPSGAAVANTRADAQGRFVLDHLPNMPLLLVAAHASCRVPPDCKPRDLRVPARGAAELRLERGTPLHGQVLDPEGRPLAGALLFAEGVKSGGQYTDAEGRFDFPAVFAAEVRLRLRHPRLQLGDEAHPVGSGPLRVRTRRR